MSASAVPRTGPSVPPKEEFETRIRRLTAAMASAQLDELLVYGWMWRTENVRYLTGSGAIERPLLLRVRPDGTTTALTTSRLDARAVSRQGWLAQTITEPVLTEQGVTGLFEGAAPGSRIGVTHLDYLPVGIRDLVSRAVRRAKLADATRVVDLVRMVKSPWERARVAHSATVASHAWDAMLAALRPGVREHEVVAAAERQLKSLGAEDNFMIIAFGRTDVRSMHPPVDRRLEPGDLVRTELSPQVDGYYAQVCRTAVLGAPDAHQQRAYAVFREATEAGIAAVRPGVTSHEVAKAENDVLRANGFGEYCTPQHTRVRGHGLGLHLDELAGLQEGDETVIPEGATLIVHPNTYANEAGYMVVGDPLAVTATGASRLARAADELPVAEVRA